MRPRAVTITTWLMGILNLLGYALLLDVQKPRSVIVTMFAIFTLMIAVGYVVLWFFWQGRNWARILVFLTCFLCLYNVRNFSSANAIVKVMLLGEAAVAVFLVYWLNTSRAKTFFKKAFRVVSVEKIAISLYESSGPGAVAHVTATAKHLFLRGRKRMNVYGDLVMDEMSRAHSKVEALALSGTETARKPS